MWRMWKLVVFAALASACNANVTDGASAAIDDTVDASAGGGDDSGDVGGSDAATGGASDAATTSPDAAPAAACPNGRLIYLAFEGMTLTQSATSDATQNRVKWMTKATAQIPPYRANDVDRATGIQTIVNGVTARLSNTPITIVTQRPPAGSTYVMVVFGGTNTNVGTPYTLGTNEHDCGDVVKNDVAWIADGPTISFAQDLAIGAIGWGLGLNGTNAPTDCMCGWANACGSQAGACTLSSSIATTPANSPEIACPNQNPQDEVAAFSTGFCQ